MGMEFDPSTLQGNLAALRKRMAVNGQRRAVRAGAQVIAEAMISRAPVLDEKTAGSNSLDPGDLKAGVSARTRQIDGQIVGLAGPKGKQGRIGKVAYNVEYGHRMVVGGKSRLNSVGQFTGEGKAVGDVPAHPFLRPAFEASAGEAIDAMAVELREELKGTATNG